MTLSPFAGRPAPASALIDVAELRRAYYDPPDPSEPEQRIAFGTSGHRGSSLSRSFNEAHILAITQAICLYRQQQRIDGPLFLGIDTHALSAPAFETALGVLSANGIDVMIANAGEPYTPTPAVSRAILAHNRMRTAGLADGIVVTPSHNPPEDGGFKYNPPTGGPADTEITRRIETCANSLLEKGVRGIRRFSFEKALAAATTHRFDYAGTYVADLAEILDLEAVRDANVRLGVDPLGGAGVPYWHAIAERYRLDLTVVNEVVDPTFGFMSVDWDGKIRMDPSSPYAMQRLIGLKDRFDIAVACDTDHDRHGIVTKTAGLMAPNHYLAVLVDYLFRHRKRWDAAARIGKTAVTTQMIDRIATQLDREVYETPVGFKWFVEGLLDGGLGAGVEESAGASFLRRDGSAWTTDKDGIAAALLAAEITARTGRDPSEQYEALAQQLGAPAYRRVDAPASPAQKAALARLSPEQARCAQLAGERDRATVSHARGNGAPLGGVKMMTDSAWFAARPSGTENVYKIYAESFRGEAHLKQVLEEAQAMVDRALAGSPVPAARDTT